MNECSKMRSGQIPAFGNWDYANELPITQYFESARQAGLLRYSSSSGECDLYMVSADLNKNMNQPSHAAVPSKKTTTAATRRAMREKRTTHVKEQRKQQQQQVVGKVVSDVTQPSTKKNNTTTIQNHQHLLLLQQHHHNYNNHNAGPMPKLPGMVVLKAPKPVDEDLYKISPDLLNYSSKRKKMLGFFPRCLLPPCVV